MTLPHASTPRRAHRPGPPSASAAAAVGGGGGPPGAPPSSSSPVVAASLPPWSPRRAAAALLSAASLLAAALLLASLAAGGGGPLESAARELSGALAGEAIALPSMPLRGTGGKGGASSGGAAAAALAVFQPHPSSLDPDGGGDERDAGATRRELNRMRASVLADSPGSEVEVEHVVLDREGQRAFLRRRGSDCHRSEAGGGGGADGSSGGGGGGAVLERYDLLVREGQPHLAAELWKFCSLLVRGGAYLDPGSPLLSTFRDAFLPPGGGEAPRNAAVLGDPSVPYARHTVHGSFLMIPAPGSTVARGMARLLVETPMDELARDALAIPRALYALIAADLGLSPRDAEAAEERADGGGALVPGRNARRDGGGAGDWTLLSVRCGGMEPAGPSPPGSAETESRRIAHQCPKRGGYCCDVIAEASSSSDAAVVLATRHPLLPYQSLPPNRDLPKPYRPDKRGEEWRGDGVDNAPFIATVREEVMPRPRDGTDVTAAPNFFDVLLANDCLPSDRFCSQCLRNKKGANCKTCKSVCPCYCNALCKTEVESKFVSKRVTVRAPAYRRDPSRLVPRIVHQTWFEDVTKEKYPNMSRLIESWKRSGWEYRFYSDAAAEEYLSTHFPPEVREAYDAIKPGAFKADLFRYCVLLVDGGVYADMDVLLEANLDAAVPGDIGFMTPLDEPGMSAGHRMCLWNGLIAAAPGHPFLAKVVETVVNNIRNRFTSVDIDNMLCPDPELSVAHSYDILFTAGPCMLGMSINNLLARHPQTSFEAGDVDPWAEDRRGGEGESPPVRPDDPRLSIPGRTVLLKQNKWDMGAHRFTWEERNLVVAATDMPDYDDRDKLEGNVHYSDTHVKFGIYGLDKLYTDREVAGEDIRIVVDGPVPSSSSREGDDGEGRVGIS